MSTSDATGWVIAWAAVAVLISVRSDRRAVRVVCGP